MRIRMIEPTYPDNATTARMSEIAPEVSDDGTHIVAQEGENIRRSWGCVKTTSTVVVKTRTFAVIHVGVTHKYRGGQQWYYFERKPDAPIRRLTASQLSARRRKQVLKAYSEGKAPSWAKQPFVEKPKTNGKAEKHIRYKSVAVCEGGTYVSIFDADTEYILGKTLRQAVKSDHNGGFYVYRSTEKAERAVVPDDSENIDLPRAVLKCEVWGRSEWYGETEWVEAEIGMKQVATENTKEAWTYLKPIAVVE